MRSKKQIKKQIKHLNQYKDLTKRELDEVVDRLYERQKLYDVEWVGLRETEEKKAQKKFKTYIDKYNIEKFSDLEDLKSLVQTELLIERIREKFGKSDKIPSKYDIDSLSTLQKHVLQIKQNLGIFREEEKSDVYNYVKSVKKKFLKWAEENQLTRQRKCPHCGKFLMLLMRTDKYDVKKHPFISDSVITNKHLLKLYKEGKITKDDVAKVLNVSPDYITWLEDNLEK